MLTDPGSGPELVLLKIHMSTATGTFLGAWQTELNNLIAGADADAGVSTGYTVDVADLSGWPDYG